MHGVTKKCVAASIWTPELVTGNDMTCTHQSVTRNVPVPNHIHRVYLEVDQATPNKDIAQGGT